ncbi:hypothetical protein H6B13_17360 [Bacteroides gallinaceum]|uniref:hypothetical protein n=1 Tax=Bacteroides gallinaceum TaxID=1462571 RepID=UPI00195C63AD|nr:hypothetical protein [Bacteroides gallinaceum]MBM6721380.1 hypothetical protein [Bacteroides gallinaceum]
MAQQKAMYANAYERWTDEDDQRLLYLYSQGKKISELMQIFARNKGAIKSRILKLTGKKFTIKYKAIIIEYRNLVTDSLCQ